MLSGSTVDYTFLATNVGQSPIAQDDVLDTTILLDATLPSNPGCRVPVLVAKEGGNQDDFLERDPAETWRYTCQGTITRRTVDLAAVGALGGSTIGDRIPVTDFATAQVTAFHPGIEVDKTATPATVEAPGGEVTYTYRVRNTGDVPLGDVADRVTDDTCSPVTYVSGDIDGDGLLDSPVSIFEDALDETWVFTCTAFVDEDTVNTVVVEGTPVDPGGDPLCGPDTDPATEPCDVNGRDRARGDPRRGCAARRHRRAASARIACASPTGRSTAVTERLWDAAGRRRPALAGGPDRPRYRDAAGRCVVGRSRRASPPRCRHAVR